MSPPPNIAVALITNGRWHYLEQTIESAVNNLRGANFTVYAFVDLPSATTIPRDLEVYADLVTYSGGGAGVDGITRIARAHLDAMGFVFWLEEDFTFDRPVDLDVMAALLDEIGPRCGQLALKRHPVFPSELRGGDVFARYPLGHRPINRIAHLRRPDPEGGTPILDAVRYCRHRLFWTANPHLTTGAHLRAHEWPVGLRSERRYARDLFEDEANFVAYLGWADDRPRVTHIGAERTGIRY